MKSREELNALSKVILDAAFKVHSAFGAGLLESAYESLLHHELLKKGLMVGRQLSVPLIHEEVKLDVAYKLDLLIDSEIIIEIKSVDKLMEVHFKQLLTYLRLTNKRLGLLINFNEVSLKNGIHRMVNNF